MHFQGRITEWRDEKGYGFITPNGGGELVFLHIKAFKHKSRRPVGGERVTFKTVKDDRGRPRAEYVEYALEPQETISKRSAGTPILIFVFLFLTAVGILSIAKKLPFTILCSYLGLSFLTFVVYAKDKSAARTGHWRTQESTLQLLALLGGWPGGLIAQQVLQHKSRKRSFQLVFWGTIVVNLTVFSWLLSPGGAGFLASLIRG